MWSCALLQKFQEQIKMVIPSCKKEQASAYGEIYSLAIKGANPAMREVCAECQKP
jgi:hypothetical protein